MAGQDAVNAARAFNEALSLTGVILTKADGDARGGAALSVRQVTGKPILVRRHGREIRGARAVPTRAHRVAHPRHGRRAVAGRTGPGARSIRKKPRSSPGRSARGSPSIFSDLRDQLSQLQKMGGMSAVASTSCRLSCRRTPPQPAGQVNPKVLKRQMGIIDSMTPRERRRPEIIDATRASGVSRPVRACRCRRVNRLLKQFDQMQKTMKKLDEGRHAQEYDARHGRAHPSGLRSEALESASRPRFGAPLPAFVAEARPINPVQLAAWHCKGGSIDGDDPIDPTRRQEKRRSTTSW